MSAFCTLHFQASAPFNWLDAMSADKAYFDPRYLDLTFYPISYPKYLYRTSDLHRLPLPFRDPSYPLDDLHITGPALVHSQPTKASTTTWVQQSLDIWETEGFEPVPADDIENAADVDDDSESLLGLKLEQLQLELKPPSSKPSTGKSLLSLHDQINTPRKQRHPASQPRPHQIHSVQQTEIDHDSWPEEPILYHPILIDPVLEPSAYAFSDFSSSMASSTDQFTPNLGTLIANKVRQAAAYSAATCRTLRKRLNL
ncbi:hypothetical protein F1880_006367 [Penicillium rolfsii]|nr:hypothetical protein F1880_006367 [Penicillium rolfsii]